MRTLSRKVSTVVLFALFIVISHFSGINMQMAYPLGIQPMLAGGGYHSLFLKSDGIVWACGLNKYGQLGDGTTTDRSTPVRVQGLSDVVAVAAGTFHSLALKSDGTVWAWGSNSEGGQLGDGTTTNRTTPVQVKNLTGVVAVAAGGYHSLALKSDGTVWAWGYNNNGQLGDGTTTNRSIPVQVNNLTGVVAVATGGYHSLALKSDGTVWAWGDNYRGQLGDGTTTDRYAPVQVQGLSGVVAVAAGTYHSLALKSDGTVWAWGYNNNGQLGDGTTTNRSIPVQVNNLTGVVAVATGGYHSLALKSDGTVWAWGDNYRGKLGDGTTTDRYAPVQVQGLSDMGSVTAGYVYSLALKSDGTVWTWGTNDYGQLGDGTTTDRKTPVQVNSLNLGQQVVPDALLVSPVSLSIAAGQTWQLSVVLRYSDGSSQDVTTQASYSSSNGAVAAVSATGLVTAVAPGAAYITVTYQDKTVTITVTVTEATLIRINVTPNPVVVVKGGSQQLGVIATYSDGSTKDVTGVASYQVGDSSIATVNNGLVQGLAAGSTNLTVTYQDQTTTVPVTVVEPSTTVKQTGDIIVLKVPERLQSVTYNSAAGFTVTENGVDVPVIKVEVKDGTDGWPFSEVWLYLQHPVTVGSDVVVRYNPDPNYPLIPIGGGTVTVPVTTVINHSTVPLTLERSTVVVQPGGNAVYITFPTKVKVVEYQGSAGYTVYSGGTPIQVTRVVTDGNGAYLYLEHPVPQGETVTISYTPVQGQEITTVTGTPLSGTTTPVTVVNQSTSPVVIYEPPVVSEDGRTVVISAPADLQDVIYEGNAGFRVFVGDREIPVVKVEVKDNNIILYLGAPLIGGQVPTIEYVPVEGQSIETVNGTPLSGIDNLQGNNQSTLSLDSITVEPASMSLVEGETGKLTLTAHYSDGSAVDVTTLASYQIDNSQVAMVSDEGLVTGVKAGNANITITYEGKTVTVPVVITAKPPVLTNITVSPNPVSIAKGQSRQVMVTATYSDGSTKDVTGDASYQAGDNSVINVSKGLVQGLAEGNTILTVTYQGKSVQVPVTVTAPAVESLKVEPAQVSLPKVKTQQLRVTAILSDGTSEDVTGQAAYSSSDTGVATVSADGKVYGTGTGSATVSVTYGGKMVQVRVEITQPAVEALTVEPSSVTLAKGKSQQLVVKATLSDGSTIDVTGQAAYNSANTNVAAVSAGGNVSGVSEGNTTVTVSYQGKSVDVPVVVSAPVVEALTVEPQSVSLPKGKEEQLRVTATLSDGSTTDVTALASYAAADQAVAAVSAGGKITGVGEGNTTVTVSYGGKQVSVPVAVTAPAVESLTVEPESVTIPKGKAQQLVVRATLSDGSTVEVTGQAQFSSNNSGIASVSPDGKVTGMSTGNATVTVSCQGKTVSVPVTVTDPVVEALVVEPAQVTLAKGKVQQLVVKALLSDGSTVEVTPQAAYNSANAGVAGVSPDGKVTGTAVGSTTVTISYQGKSVNVPVTVTEPVVEALSVEPAQVTIPAGKTQQLVVKATLSDGTVQDVTAQAVYASGNSSVAGVAPGGVVTGAGAGSTTVSVSYGGKQATVPLVVTAPVVTGLKVEPASVTLEIGQSQQLKVTAQYSDGSARDVTAEASYSSSNNAVALVNAGGLLTAVKDGTCAVTATYQGQNASASVTVKAPAVVSIGIGISPNPVTVNKYGSVKLTVVIVYSNGSTQDVSASAQYATADAAIATVKTNGVVYGKKVGQTELVVTYNGKNYRVPVAVSDIPVVSQERSTQQQPIVVYPDRSSGGEPVVVYPSS